TGTPPPIVATLNHQITAALDDPKMKARIDQLGGVPLPMSPAEFGKFVAGETEKMSKVIKLAGISVRGIASASSLPSSPRLGDELPQVVIALRGPRGSALAAEAQHAVRTARYGGRGGAALLHERDRISGRQDADRIGEQQKDHG